MTATAHIVSTEDGEVETPTASEPLELENINDGTPAFSGTGRSFTYPLGLGLGFNF